MLKRLIQVAFLTGAAHVFTVFSLKFISLQINPSELKSVGEIDSISNFIIVLVALGLLMATVRDIALLPDWKTEFKHAQKARITLSLCIMPLGLLYFFEKSYLVFFAAPFFALNGDYALYGRSLPVTASVLAFIKVFLPGLALIVTSIFYPQYLISAFVAAIIFCQIFTGYFVSRKLNVPYIIFPDKKALPKYIRSINLGIVSLAFYFLGLGLIWVATFIYEDVVVARAYLGIKIYIIFKGVLRMINQSFIREMIDDNVGLKVDQLAFIGATVFVIAGIIFPLSFTSIFLGHQFIPEVESLTLLVISGICCACFTSFTTKAMLEKKDSIYSMWSLISIVAAVLASIILSFFMNMVRGIYLSLLIGEFVFLVGLLKTINNYELVRKRVTSMIEFIPYLLIPVLIRFIFGDTVKAFVCSICIYGFILCVSQYKKFSSALLVIE
jgi:hypothetical protein